MDYEATLTGVEPDMALGSEMRCQICGHMDDDHKFGFVRSKVGPGYDCGRVTCARRGL